MYKYANARDAVLDMSVQQELNLLKWLAARHCHRISAPVLAPDLLTSRPDWPVMGGDAAWWRDKLRGGVLLHWRDWTDRILIKDLTADYTHAMGLGGMSKRGSATAMGRSLSRLVPGLEVTTRTAGLPRGVRWRCYRFPPLEICRGTFEAVYGPQDWSLMLEHPRGGRWIRGPVDCLKDEVPKGVTGAAW